VRRTHTLCESGLNARVVDCFPVGQSADHIAEIPRSSERERTPLGWMPPAALETSLKASANRRRVASGDDP